MGATSESSTLPSAASSSSVPALSFDESHQNLGGVIKIFNDTCKEPLEEVLKEFYPKERDVIAFGEYVGPQSFAGMHFDPPEAMKFVLFDVMFIQRDFTQFLMPQEFIKFVEKLNGIVPTPRVIYDGNLTDDFIKRVRNNEFGVNEGVVCKGREKTGAARGKVWMCKIKTNEYMGSAAKMAGPSIGNERVY